ncbi:SDR family oxidoreductase [Nocardia sp. NPDC059180]|uniref:SDR family oxidoreductase n=1 Tax=Nocardia sp. NPDC059180 TaxID=3346761 RepID=UPI0036C15BC8
MTSQLTLHGKVVAITGGARGIGAATARAFAAAGAHVVIGDIDQGAAEITAAEIGHATVALGVDVTDRASFARYLDAVAHQFGTVDVLVNNAGVMPIVEFDQEAPDSVRRQVDINLLGVLWGSQLAIQAMLAAGRGGHIVNVASAAGKLTFPGVATYNATKFAVVGLTEALAAEYRNQDITFSLIMPALVRTELADGVGEHWALRKSDPEQVADAIVRATRRRTFEVAVPRELQVLYRLHAVLPHSVAAFTIRALGGDSYISEAGHHPHRRQYDQRITGTDAPETKR